MPIVPRPLTSHARSAFVALSAIAAGCILFASGCAHYVTPGASADFRALGITQSEADAQTDLNIAERLNRKPLAAFPATVAVVRLQGRDYSSFTTTSYGHGDYSIVSTRDVETQEQFDRFASLPMIRGLVPVNRLVMPGEIRSERDVRNGAANLQADLVLLYTFDTRFGKEKIVPFMGVITLGFFPDREAQVASTASAVIIDTRNGYVYAAGEATVKQEQLSNAWTSTTAIDQARRRAETEAFDKLVDQMAVAWKGVVEQYVVNPPKVSASINP